ncbi:MAG TPA: nuclear transport factor 2 family protein, partial [Candidatus Angelobacter sp.]|nr:nuclear transport factor 2 family protein [Candidatus Angelobacter sp.]
MRVPLIMRVIPVLAVTVLLAAQEPWKPPLTSRIKTSTRQVVLFTNLETQMLQAVQKKNQAALTAMLTDDFAIDMPNADRMAGEDWVDSVMSKDFALEKFGVHQMSVIDLGNAAVVKYERLQ